MIRFECDYAEGAHPAILARLAETNMEQTPGYGEDEHCRKAAGYIKTRCGRPEADVHFMTGGTQTNLTVIAAALRPHQGVVSAAGGHIGTHETGAVEATGHKVLTLTGDGGKLTASQVDELCRVHQEDGNREHTVQPGLVYISHPTESGTLYTKKELAELKRVCAAYDIPLYIDGARLGYGLAVAERSPEIFPDLRDIASLCDIFYIGGTKVGAMFGEALVILDDRLKKDFRYQIKQRGAMLAKGRLLGIQFEVLFEGGLYEEISRHAVAMADLLRQACAGNGFPLLYDAPANQIFPVLPESAVEKLARKYAFFVWEKTGERDGQPAAAVRLCTSWASKEEQVRQLAEDIMAL